MPGQAELAHETFTASIPLGRYGDPLDIANMMLYLARMRPPLSRAARLWPMVV